MSLKIVDWLSKNIADFHTILSGKMAPVLLLGRVKSDGSIALLNADTYTITPDGGEGIMKVVIPGEVQISAGENVITVAQEASTRLCVPFDNETVFVSSPVTGDGTNDKDISIQTGDPDLGWLYLFLYADTSGGVAKLVDVAVDLYWSNDGNTYTRFAQFMPETATHHHPQPFNCALTHRYLKATLAVPGNGDVFTMTALKTRLKVP